MRAMTSTSRIMLLHDPRASVFGPEAAKVRRYRLARVRLAERRDELEPRHAHLLRAHD